jgi:hypothetical protein
MLLRRLNQLYFAWITVLVRLADVETALPESFQSLTRRVNVRSLVSWNLFRLLRRLGLRRTASILSAKEDFSRDRYPLSCFFAPAARHVYCERTFAQNQPGIFLEPLPNRSMALAGVEGSLDFRPKRPDLASLGNRLFRAPLREAVPGIWNPRFFRQPTPFTYKETARAGPGREAGRIISSAQRFATNRNRRQRITTAAKHYNSSPTEYNKRQQSGHSKHGFRHPKAGSGT